MSETEYTYHDLHKMTVARLREIASGIDHPAVQGYTQLHKDKVLEGICTALNIEMHEHYDLVGINKRAVKAKIAALKIERQTALEAKDRPTLKLARRKIRRLKRKMRRAMV